MFLNERGEVTEGSRTNVFVERDGVWLTPPLSCGALDGCLRREMIEAGAPRVEERVLVSGRSGERSGLVRKRVARVDARRRGRSLARVLIAIGYGQ